MDSIILMLCLDTVFIPSMFSIHMYTDGTVMTTQ